MGILVGFLDHMVGVDVVGAHTIIIGGVTPPVMTDRIQVTTPLNGIQVARMEVTGGAAFQVLKFRIRRAGKHFLVDGVPEAVEAAEVIVVVGEVGREVGAAPVLPTVGLRTVAVGGVVAPRKLLTMDGLAGVGDCHGRKLGSVFPSVRGFPRSLSPNEP
ncbi:uncharacterized protein LOC125316040 [Rhodamnia argentea]|uniref:Uncharacterized protein LOC125316040 n=1 Tax=Rhodamnia argentea TaxID=178133 RepID=A0ABM3HQG8_9MYRT|nr:uncharacterized protein LOC125316040 [Rhodamnia argentea]